MLQNNQQKVIFIAGTGRSGSTLLDILLGQIDGFCSTGELRFIWDRGFMQNQLCGCGKPFKVCDFWMEVEKQAFGSIQKKDAEMLTRLRKRIEQNLRIPIWGAGKVTTVHPAHFQDYFDAYQKLYQAIHKVSGCDVIVDSSKNAAHGFNLAAIADIDLLTLHITRDSRAVAYSWQRKKVRPEIYWQQQFMHQRGVIKSAIKWNHLNLLAHKLQRVSKHYTFLRYEDLVTNPTGSLSKLLSALGLETTAFNFLDGSLANLKNSHTVSGNPMRFERKEIKIKPDTQWESDMTRSHKLLVTLLTWPLLMKYRYLKSDRNHDKQYNLISGLPIMDKKYRK